MYMDKAKLIKNLDKLLTKTKLQKTFAPWRAAYVGILDALEKQEEELKQMGLENYRLKKLEGGCDLMDDLKGVDIQLKKQLKLNEELHNQLQPVLDYAITHRIDVDTLLEEHQDMKMELKRLTGSNKVERKVLL